MLAGGLHAVVAAVKESVPLRLQVDYNADVAAVKESAPPFSFPQLGGVRLSRLSKLLQSGLGRSRGYL